MTAAHLRPGTERPCRLLVSVRDADEAGLACAAGADLVDAKDPERGALGALPAGEIRAIVARVGDRARTSAVAGEARDSGSTEPETIGAVAVCGVDLVKIALPAGPVAPTALARAAGAAPGRLIAVLFAEDVARPGGGLDVQASLAAAGFRGAMLDTRGKGGRRLTELLPPEHLAAFVSEARAHGLLCGLAGSLRIADIPRLAAFAPDYLGLRGGLCLAGDRRRALDPGAVRAAARALNTARRAAA